MRPFRPVPTTVTGAVAVVLAFAGLTACSGGDVEDAKVGAQSGPSRPGGTGPAPGGVLPDDAPSKTAAPAPPAGKPAAELTGRELADRAVQLMAATSYRLSGVSGTGPDAATLSILVSKQRDAVQTVTRPDLKQELIRVGGVVYTNIESVVGGPGTPPLPPSLRGTYFKAEGQQLDPMLVDPFAGTFGAGSGEVAKGEVIQVDGKGVWPLTVRSSDGGTTTMYVMAAGDPYPIKLTVGGADPLDLKVSDFGADVPVSAPAPDRVVDQATLQQRMAAAGA